MARRRAALNARAGALLAAVSVASAGGACARGRDADLRFWAFGREGEVVREMIPDFEKRHPGLHVRVQQVPWTAAHEKLLTAFVGRQLPDVAQLGNTWIPELSALGALVPLDGRLSHSTPRADYFPGIWDTNVIDGVLWGVPWYVDTRVLFYRADLLREAGVARPPRTWAELDAALEALRQRAGPSQFPILLPTDEWAQPFVLGFQAGSPLLRDGGRYGAFRGAEFRKAAAFYVSLFTRGFAPTLSNAQVSNVYQQFDSGDFMSWITGPWNLGEFRRRLPAGRDGAWSTAPLPAAEGGEVPGVSLAGGSSLALFRGSPREDAAWALVEFLSEPAQQARFYALVGDLPARRSVWKVPPLATDAKAAAFAAQLEHVQPAPKVPEWESIAQRMAERLQEVVHGGRSLDSALEVLDGDADRILGKRRELLDRRTPRAR